MELLTETQANVLDVPFKLTWLLRASELGNVCHFLRHQTSVKPKRAEPKHAVVLRFGFEVINLK
jgi:hypothetical protein